MKAPESKPEAPKKPILKREKGDYPFFLRRLNTIMAKTAGFKRTEGAAFDTYKEYNEFLKSKNVPQETINAAYEEFFNYKG